MFFTPNILQACVQSETSSQRPIFLRPPTALHFPPGTLLCVEKRYTASQKRACIGTAHIINTIKISWKWQPLHTTRAYSTKGGQYRQIGQPRLMRGTLLVAKVMIRRAQELLCS